MSSMYLYHRYGLSSISLKISSSNSAINNILYGGANFVPIAVPRFYFKVFSIKVKILFLRTTSASSTSVEVMTSFSCLKSSRSRRADRSSSCGMLRYKPTIYIYIIYVIYNIYIIYVDMGLYICIYIYIIYISIYIYIYTYTHVYIYIIQQ